MKTLSKILTLGGIALALTGCSERYNVITPVGFADFNGDSIPDPIVMKGRDAELGCPYDSTGNSPQNYSIGYVDGTRTAQSNGVWRTTDRFNMLEHSGHEYLSGAGLDTKSDYEPGIILSPKDAKRLIDVKAPANNRQHVYIGKDLIVETEHLPGISDEINGKDIFFDVRPSSIKLQ